jgi:uncharacterized protein (DUF433 family)
MAEAETGRIERVLMDEPHLAGRRIPVIQIHDLVEGRGDRPEQVAETFDLDIADVYYALAFYHDHRDEMEQYRAKRRQAYDAVEVDRPPGVEPPE